MLARQSLEWLAVHPGQTIVDGTLGGAGHFRQLAALLWPEDRAENDPPTGRLIGIDRDQRAIDAATQALSEKGWLTGRSIDLVNANYRRLPAVLDMLGVGLVDGVLLDLGLSSDQLADESRGFSFDSEGPLDLRFDIDEGQPAWQWIARQDARSLANAIYEFGEERFSRRIASALVEAARDRSPKTAREVAEIVRRAIPRAARQTSRIDPATRTFQALRIAVNRELEALDEALAVIPDRLRPGGRLAIISFHSLEDRRVKEAFRQDDRLKPLTKKPLRPDDEELDANPRSRSARLRVAERTDCR